VPVWVDLLASVAASLSRMIAAYVVSVILALTVGSLMAKNRTVERILLPVLDVLQSIPILGFFPAALVFFVTYLPGGIGAEAASVFLIVTSLVWNMIFGVYSSVKSLDPQFEDMAKVYGFGHAARFFYIYTPASRNSLVANSLVSWAGGWFFLTSAEVISLGSAEYRLRGLGSFILDNFNAGNLIGFYLGVAALLTVIVATYILVWNPAASIVLGRSLPGVVRSYEAVHFVVASLWSRLTEATIRIEKRFLESRVLLASAKWLALLAVACVLVQALLAAWGLLSGSVFAKVVSVLVELPLSLARVALVVVFSFATSLLVAYFSYRSRVFSAAMTLGGELLASIPAIVWWPLLAGIALGSRLGSYAVSFIVFLQGSFWYLYFNILVYGLGSIRKDFEELAEVYHFGARHFFRYIFVPSLLPSVAAGALSAWGGAWNASVVAEYVEVSGRTIDLGGVGALLNRLTVSGDTLGLMLSALVLSLVIVAINKTLWSRFFNYIEGRYVGE